MIVLAPVVILTSATCESGIFVPLPLVSISDPIFSGVFRYSSFSRQVTSYDLLPTKTCEMALPPIANSISSVTSETFSPYCAIRSRSAMICNCGSGGS